MSGMYEAIRMYLMNLAFEGKMPLSFQYGFVINALLCAFFIGPVLGGFIFQNYGSETLWAGVFVLGVLLSLGFLAMSIPARRRAQALKLESQDAPA